VPSLVGFGFEVGLSFIGYKCLFLTPIRDKILYVFLELKMEVSTPKKERPTFKTELLKARHISRPNFFVTVTH
jgi:hypothetical protein